MPVAEEVHHIFPEGEGALKRCADDPAHQLFRRFGEAMPEEDWRDPGTKQGVYMMGPDGEYLDGGGAISGNAPRVLKRMERALKRWKSVRKKKRYKAKKVPRGDAIAPPAIADKPMVLRVFLRDLPRGDGDDSGRRFTKRDLRGMWLDFTKWAWNVNWIGFDDPGAFVPKSRRGEEVDPAVALRLCRKVLVDNVRGQTPGWKPEEVRTVELRMQRVDTERGRVVIEYRGAAEMESETQSFNPKLYGRASWDAKAKAFESFELLAIGERSGHGVFNQRARDQGPAPMGIALVLHRPKPSAR